MDTHGTDTRDADTDTRDTVTGHVRQALQDAASRRELAAVARRAGVAWVTARDIAEGRTADPRASVLERLGRAAGLGDLQWTRGDTTRTA